MIFDARASRREALQNIAPGPPASIGERQAADFKAFVLAGASFSADVSIYAEYDRYLDEIRQVTGRTFDNPLDFAALQLERNQRDLRLTGVRDVAEVPTLAGREQQLFEELSALSEKFPNLFVRSPEQIRQGIADQRRTARANAASVAERDSTLSGFLSFFTNAGLSMADPPVLASMVFAPGATNVVRGAAIDAAIATAAEIPLQATLEASGLRFGEKPSLTRAATNVLAVGAGAGAFSGIIRTAGRGLAMRKARREAAAERRKAKAAGEGDASADAPAQDIGGEDGLSPEAGDARVYAERQADMAAQTPFGPEGAAEHAHKYSQALESVRDEGRVADLGEPEARPLAPHSAAASRAASPQSLRGTPNSFSRSTEAGGALSTENASVPPAVQADPSQLSTRPEPSENSTIRDIPPSNDGPDVTATTVLGGIDQTSNKKIVQPSRDINELRTRATEALEPLNRDLTQAVADLPSAQVIGARVKKLPRLKEKLADRPPETISDFLGARVLIDDPADMGNALGRLAQRFRIIDVDDFLENPRNGGYRAIHVQVLLPDSKLSAEVQILPGPIARAQKKAHAIYGRWRNVTEFTPEQHALMKSDLARSKALFEVAWREWLDAGGPRGGPRGGGPTGGRGGDPKGDGRGPGAVRAFDDGDILAPTEDRIREFGRDLAAETRAEAAKSSAGHAVRETFGPLDQSERASLLGQIRRPPKLPKVTRLVQFLVNGGGLKDPGGDVRAIIGGARGRPGLMNNKTGQSLDDAGERAFEAGFFDERPTEAELLAALADDFDGTEPRFSSPDDAIAFNESRDNIDSLEELGAALDDLGIDVRALDDAAISARIDALADDAVAPPRPNDPAPPSAIDRARLAETRAAGAEDAEGEILAAIEAEVRDTFADELDTKLWVEDADGNPVQRSARQVFADLDEEDFLLSEWLDCAGQMGVSA